MQLTLDAFDAASQDWLVQLTPRRRMSRAEYVAFVETNPDLRIERTADGEVIVMPAAHSRTGSRNFELAVQVGIWVREDGRGTGFASSTGFDLPNGSNRSPDISWVLNSRLDALTAGEQRDYYALCPDFVIELRSGSDRLSRLRDKMQEYIDNGASLGWLIDPIERTVHIYRPNRIAEFLEQPTAVNGDPELPGLTLDLAPVWK